MTFIDRAKRNLVQSIHQVLLRSARFHDRLEWIGKDEDRQLVRLVGVLCHCKRYRDLTNELDLDRLPAEYVVFAYRQRW